MRHVEHAPVDEVEPCDGAPGRLASLRGRARVHVVLHVAVIAHVGDVPWQVRVAEDDDLRIGEPSTQARGTPR